MTSTTVEDLMIRNIFGVFGERDAAARAAAADPPIARGAAESVAGRRSGHRARRRSSRALTAPPTKHGTGTLKAAALVLRWR